jgi:hypothetical protein
MRKTRTIVAVTLLATALCADRAVAASSSARGGTPVESGPAVRGFAQRLTVSLRRVVPAVKMGPTRVEGAAPAAMVSSVDGDQALTHDAEGVPFLFRLPPPVA